MTELLIVVFVCVYLIVSVLGLICIKPATDDGARIGDKRGREIVARMTQNLNGGEAPCRSALKQSYQSARYSLPSKPLRVSRESLSPAVPPLKLPRSRG